MIFSKRFKCVVKQFLKLVGIWLSYDKKSLLMFFGSQCIYVCLVICNADTCTYMCYFGRIVAQQYWVSALFLEWNAPCSPTVSSRVFLRALWQLPICLLLLVYLAVSLVHWILCWKPLNSHCIDASTALSTCYLYHTRCVCDTLIVL